MSSLSPLDRCATARRRLIGQLRRSDMRGAMKLAGILAACTSRAPCGSAACFACGMAFQRSVVGLFERFVRMPARSVRSRMTAVTIIPTRGCVDLDELSAEVFEEVRDEVGSAIDNVGLPPFIVGIEASFNEDLTETVEPHWCVHAHGIGYDWLSAEQDKALRKKFPRSSMVLRPVVIEPLDQKPSGREYPFKPERFRRQTYLKVFPEGHRNPCRASRRKSLRPWQAVRLAMVEHEVGFDGRLLTHGLNEEAVEQHFRGWKWARDGP